MPTALAAAKWPELVEDDQRGEAGEGENVAHARSRIGVASGGGAAWPGVPRAAPSGPREGPLLDPVTVPAVSADGEPVSAQYCSSVRSKNGCGP